MRKTHSVLTRVLFSIALLAVGCLLVAGCADDVVTGPDMTTEASTDYAAADDQAAHQAAASKRAGHGEAGRAVYEVTITNLSAGQPLTPPLLAVHRKPASLFTVGSPASFELKEIAENGNLGPMLSNLEDNKHVLDVQVSGSGPLVPEMNPGGTSFSHQTTLEVTSERGAMYLSFASMLICTNDGITGVDGQRLPNGIGETVTVYTAGYDAGTEMNTEDFADMVPPCQGLIGVPTGETGTGVSNPAIAEDEVVRHHPGISGGADLDPEIHGWTDPIARVVIRRSE